MIDRRPPWQRRGDRLRIALIAVIGAFIVWTSLVPRPAPGWDGAHLTPRVPSSLPLPTLLLILVVVAVIVLMNRRRLL